jgi:transposase-like protein
MTTTAPTTKASAKAIDSLRLDRIIREHCEAVLAMTDGHVQDAAKILGCGWTTLYRWIREWEEADSREGKDHDHDPEPHI